eukprot:13822807-Alexandrium_andersonii.AAC.1
MCHSPFTAHLARHHTRCAPYRVTCPRASHAMCRVPPYRFGHVSHVLARCTPCVTCRPTMQQPPSLPQVALCACSLKWAGLQSLAIHQVCSRMPRRPRATQ